MNPTAISSSSGSSSSNSRKKKINWRQEPMSKENQSIVCVDIVEACSKTLPPPPVGYFWEQNPDDHTWHLLSMPTILSTPSLLGPDHDPSILFTKPSIIEHVLMPSDTLQGLCLRYRVSAVELRRANLFSGNNIHFKATLLIPIHVGTRIIPQIETNDVLVQKFKNITGEGLQESRLYLEDSQWNFEKALDVWKQDQDWENEYHIDYSMNTSQSNNFASELPAEDIVEPLSIDLPKVVEPVMVSVHPPVAAAPVSSSSAGSSIFGFFRRGRGRGHHGVVQAHVVEASETFLIK